jgi:hypothetical protein
VPAITENVIRPAPGLAAGRYEAQSWMFVAVLVAAAIACILYVFARIRGHRKQLAADLLAARKGLTLVAGPSERSRM